jgi:hypothetical protein
MLFLLFPGKGIPPLEDAVLVHRAARWRVSWRLDGCLVLAGKAFVGSHTLCVSVYFSLSLSISFSFSLCRMGREWRLVSGQAAFEQGSWGDTEAPAVIALRNLPVAGGGKSSTELWRCVCVSVCVCVCFCVCVCVCVCLCVCVEQGSWGDTEAPAVIALRNLPVACGGESPLCMCVCVCVCLGKPPSSRAAGATPKPLPSSLCAICP